MVTPPTRRVIRVMIPANQPPSSRQAPAYRVPFAHRSNEYITNVNYSIADLDCVLNVSYEYLSKVVWALAVGLNFTVVRNACR
jgi:hypothetical protein